jgi:hypothetical protein
VPVRVTTLAGTHGESVSQLELDLREAPVPERRYVCDVAAVKFDGTTIRLLFGQQRIGKAVTLRSLVVMQLSRLAADQFLRSVDAMSKPTYAEIVSGMGTEAEALTEIDEEPEQTVALQANLLVSAAAGLEANIDFYQMSPAALSNVQRQKSDSIPIESVLRVDIRPSLMLGIINELNNLKPRLKIQALAEWYKS